MNMTSQPGGPALSLNEFALFRDFIYRQAGIRLTEAKISLIQNRLQRRLAALGLTSYQSYFTRVDAPGSDECQICVEALTTNETFFFRHKEHWDFFIGKILAQWPRDRRLKVWSAAASTGEEAYSAAISCLEHLGHQAAVTIEATDINQRVLDVAKRGIYSDYAVQKVTAYGRSRWFIQGENGWQVADAPRALINFHAHNLLESRSGSVMDVVFLRNVLIYFDDASKVQAVRHVAERMSTGAWLFLGGSESLPAGIGEFRSIRPQIFQKVT
jgi:chemotaxis protein methyltransferase CheR